MLTTDTVQMLFKLARMEEIKKADWFKTGSVSHNYKTDPFNLAVAEEISKEVDCPISSYIGNIFVLGASLLIIENTSIMITTAEGNIVLESDLNDPELIGKVKAFYAHHQ